MRDDHPLILERDGELAALSAAVAAAEAGRGAFVLVEGPAGIGKTTLLRAACRGPGLRILTARGLALERGFPYGIVRQLLDPVRVAADGMGCLTARPGWPPASSTRPRPARSKTTSRTRPCTASTGWSRTSPPGARW